MHSEPASQHRFAAWQVSKSATVSVGLGSVGLSHMWLGDFEHVLGGGGRGFGAFHQFLGNGVELGGLRALRAGERYGQAAVATFANGRDQLDGTEERNVELLRGAFGSAFGKDVDLADGNGGR